MFRISNITKQNLEHSLGVALEDFSKMSADEERKWIERRTGKNWSFSKKRKHGIMGRGNPLLSRRKIRSIDDLNYKSHIFFGI